MSSPGGAARERAATDCGRRDAVSASGVLRAPRDAGNQRERDEERKREREGVGSGTCGDTCVEAREAG